MAATGPATERGSKAANRPLDRRDIFAAHPLFEGLGPTAIEALAGRARVERMRRGKTLFRKGDPGSSLMAVLQGRIKICVAAPSGREAVLNLIGPGQVFGEIALLDAGPRTADAVALAETELLVLERRDLLPLMRAHPDIALRIMAVLCRRLRKTSEQVEDAFFLDLAGRLAKALLRLAAGEAEGAAGPVVLEVTQRQLAEMTGASRESVNKQLKAWQRAGLLRLAKSRIEIRDRERFAARLEGHGIV
jgi:CRP-like cAMP-binding protein